MADTVLVTASMLQYPSGPHLDRLQAAGYRTVVTKDPTQIADELAAGAVATVAGNEKYTAAVFAAAPKLRVVARLGVGYDNVDLQAAAAAKVAVAITPGTNNEAVAEHFFALLLALTHNILGHDRCIREGRWEQPMMTNLRTQTLGLIGYGRIGKAVAARAIPFRMRVLVHEPAFTITDPGITQVSLAELLAQSDFVSLHAPATPATHHLVNAATIAQMKRGAVVINTARGSLVDEAALIAGLESGQLGGAALDVFEREPLPESKLRDLPHVVFTPHMGATDRLALQETADMCVDTILQLAAGRWPEERLINRNLLPLPWRWER